jgi:hypothetical protein
MKPLRARSIVRTLAASVVLVGVAACGAAADLPTESASHASGGGNDAESTRKLRLQIDEAVMKRAELRRLADRFAAGGDSALLSHLLDTVAPPPAVNLDAPDVDAVQFDGSWNGWPGSTAPRAEVLSTWTTRTWEGNVANIVFGNSILGTNSQIAPTAAITGRHSQELTMPVQSAVTEQALYCLVGNQYGCSFVGSYARPAEVVQTEVLCGAAITTSSAHQAWWAISTPITLPGPGGTSIP